MPGKRSRLWQYKDINHVLTENKGTKVVQGLGSNFRLPKEVHLLRGSKHLSNELRFLDWSGYPSKSLPSSFQPMELVDLRMCYSNIEQLWKGIKCFDSLKFIKLNHSQNLIVTPDITGVPNLEKLIVEGCTTLREVHSSIGVHKRLILLNLKGCLKLEKLPENLGNAKGLKELDVSGTAIKKAPSSIVLLEKLEVLSFCGCKGPLSKSWNKALSFDLKSRKSLDLGGLPVPSLSSLSSLKTLDLSDCKVQAIPNELGYLSSLQVLDISKNDFEFIPESIIQLSNLKELYLLNCTSLRSLLKLPSSIHYYLVTGSSSLERLPDRPMPKASLELSLSLHDCFKLLDIQAHNEDSFKILGRASWEICIHDSNVGKIDLVIPRSEIPKWSRHQTIGNKMNIQVNSGLSNKWMGMALCCVLVLNVYHAPNQSLDGDTVESRYRWLIYLFPQYFEDYRNGSWSSIDENVLSQIEIRFETDGTNLEVKKCGVHLVYEQDIEDLKPSMAQCINNVTPYDDYDWLGPRREFIFKSWVLVGFYKCKKF
ncbi:disease resistance protein RPP2B-like [Quercus lobata]|uniref:disease resistance protein RPP2B-like n=1 Tax=Quercus lobata TaxID=97700 RepID=UPI00124490D0|nr:disease resistance protein RPP2B-like [Quercus lobata]